MLSSRLADQALLAGPRCIAEPKLDGQRAQVHVADGRTVACYSRPGRELLRHRALGWLRDVRWPVDRAVIDGELYSGDGAEGIDAIMAARQQLGSAVVFAAFDVLAVGDHATMPEPWTDRRKRLEDFFPAGVTDSRVQLVPTFEDASRLWRFWVVEWGGEGIVLKDRRSPYKPGTRSRSWWKAKHNLTLPVEVLQCAPALVPWGDWDQACMMRFAYRDPQTSESVTVEQAVRVSWVADWMPPRGAAEIQCWGRATQWAAPASGLDHTTPIITVKRLPAHVCPDCGSTQIIREHRVGFFERVILPLLRRRAYSCLDGNRRFYDRRRGH